MRRLVEMGILLLALAAPLYIAVGVFASAPRDMIVPDAMLTATPQPLMVAARATATGLPYSTLRENVPPTLVPIDLANMTPMPVGEPTPTPTRVPQQHIIASGDTYRTLAEKYRTTIEKIMEANPQVNPGNLEVGQVLTIP